MDIVKIVALLDFDGVLQFTTLQLGHLVDGLEAVIRIHDLADMLYHSLGLFSVLKE